MKVLIFYASAGYGHQKVAEVLAQAFKTRGLEEDEVQLVDALDYTNILFRKTYPALYYYCVKYFPALWGWFYETLDLQTADRWIRPFRRIFNRVHGQALLRLVTEENPDHILCTHFFTAELFATAKKQGRLKCRLTTVITDFYPHAVWVNEGTDFYWVMHAESKKELIRRGIAAECAVDGGIPVDPVFKPTGRREAILRKYEFTGQRLTLLVTSGSFGLGPYRELLAVFAEFADQVQCFVVCGNNAQAKQALDRESYPFPVKVFGFVDFMPELMEASDLILAKCGGATTVESLAKGVPMVVLEPIPGQETRNASFLKDRQVSFFIGNPEDIRPILHSVLKYPELIQSKVKAIHEVAKAHAADDLVSFVLEKGGSVGP